MQVKGLNFPELEMSKTIMAADDSSSVRQLICFALTNAGYNLLEASDGQYALEKLKNTQAHMVITDLNMPHLDGIRLIMALCALPAYKFIPIIMLTTESQMDKVKEGKAAGATGWIVKPFDPEHLVTVVKKISDENPTSRLTIVLISMLAIVNCQSSINTPAVDPHRKCRLD
jgi:two-component system, chemotaxis family, chemotaxis protein CheY